MQPQVGGPQGQQGGQQQQMNKVGGKMVVLGILFVILLCRLLKRTMSGTNIPSLESCTSFNMSGQGMLS